MSSPERRTADGLERAQQLVRLKRYEQPDEGYFEGFLKEFQQRQRADLMQRSSRSLFCERLGTYLADFGGRRMLLAGGAACALALLFVRVAPEGQPVDAGFDAPRGEVTPVSAGPLFEGEIDLWEGMVVPAGDEEIDLPLFMVEPFDSRRAAGEPEIIEL